MADSLLISNTTTEESISEQMCLLYVKSTNTPFVTGAALESYVHQAGTALQVPCLPQRLPWLLDFHEISPHTKIPSVKYLLSVICS